MPYQPSRFPSEMVLQILEQNKQREQQAKNAPLDNLVNALQLLANKYLSNKQEEKKQAFEINQQGNKIAAENYMTGKMNYTMPATSPQPGAEGPSAPERPYRPSIKEIISGTVPGEAIPTPTVDRAAEAASKSALNLQKMQEMQFMLGLKKELANDPVAFEKKYGKNVLQMMHAQPAFNIMDLLTNMGLGEGVNVTQPPVTPTPAPTPQTNPGSKRIRVKDIKTGQTGTIEENEFDPMIYQRL